MSGLHDRIGERLEATKKSMRQASLDGGLSGEAISKILRSPENSQTLDTVAKLARGLSTTEPWLAYGIEVDEATGLAADGSRLTVNVELLKQALQFVLRHEGVPERRAALLADILPEALSGPPVEAVKRDPFLSFQIHLQLEERRSAHPEPR